MFPCSQELVLGIRISSQPSSPSSSPSSRPSTSNLSVPSLSLLLYSPDAQSAFLSLIHRSSALLLSACNCKAAVQAASSGSAHRLPSQAATSAGDAAVQEVSELLSSGMHALSSFPSLAAAAVSSHASVVMGWGVGRVLVQGLVTSQDSDVSGRGNQGRGGGRLSRAGIMPRFRCEWLCTCQAPEKG